MRAYIMQITAHGTAALKESVITYCSLTYTLDSRTLGIEVQLSARGHSYRIVFVLRNEQPSAI